MFLQGETVAPIKDGTLLIGEKITRLGGESKLILNLFCENGFKRLPSDSKQGGSELYKRLNTLGILLDRMSNHI